MGGVSASSAPTVVHLTNSATLPAGSANNLPSGNDNLPSGSAKTLPSGSANNDNDNLPSGTVNDDAGESLPAGSANNLPSGSAKVTMRRRGWDRINEDTCDVVTSKQITKAKGTLAQARICLQRANEGRHSEYLAFRKTITRLSTLIGFLFIGVPNAEESRIDSRATRAITEAPEIIEVLKTGIEKAIADEFETNLRTHSNTKGAIVAEADRSVEARAQRRARRASNLNGLRRFNWTRQSCTGWTQCRLLTTCIASLLMAAARGRQATKPSGTKRSPLGAGMAFLGGRTRRRRPLRLRKF